MIPPIHILSRIWENKYPLNSNTQTDPNTPLSLHILKEYFLRTYLILDCISICLEMLYRQVSIQSYACKYRIHCSLHLIELEQKRAGIHPFLEYIKMNYATSSQPSAQQQLHSYFASITAWLKSPTNVLFQCHLPVQWIRQPNKR